MRLRLHEHLDQQPLVHGMKPEWNVLFRIRHPCEQRVQGGPSWLEQAGFTRFLVTCNDSAQHRNDIEAGCGIAVFDDLAKFADRRLEPVLEQIARR